MGSQPQMRLVEVVKAPVPRPVASDEGPGPSALQRRISTKTESSEASQVFIRREESTGRVDRHRGQPPSLALVAVGIPFTGHFSGFPSASHLGLPGSQLVFGISGDPLTGAHASLSQDGFY